MQYTVDYFIKKFEAIPEDLWAIGSYCDEGKFCALGHTGVRAKMKDYTEEGNALFYILIKTGEGVITINDGGGETKYQQPTPKQRILAALYDIKKMQEPEEPKVKEIIRYIAVPETISESIPETIFN
jgi:hypothetical protein